MATKFRHIDIKLLFRVIEAEIVGGGGGWGRKMRQDNGKKT